MWISPLRPLVHPTHEIEIRRPIDLHGIPIELIKHESVVSIGSKLIGYQLTVLPDANHVGQEKNGGFFVDGLAARFGNVGFYVTKGGQFSSWFAARIGLLVCICRARRGEGNLLVLDTDCAALRDRI